MKKTRLVSKEVKQKELKGIVEEYFSKNPQTKKLLSSYKVSAERYNKAISALSRSPLQVSTSSTVNYE